MKHLLLTIPLLMSTMAIGPCNPVPIGSLDGGGDGPVGSGGAAVDAGSGGSGEMGGGTGGAGGGATGGGSGGRGSGGDPAGTGGEAGAGVIACDGSGWRSESIFYAGGVPVDFDLQLDANDALHLVNRAAVVSSGVAYIRRPAGGTFDWPATFVSDRRSALPRVWADSTGGPHVAWTDSGANDNMYYATISDDGSWPIEQAVTGMLMNPLAVRAFNGTLLVVYAGPDGGAGGFRVKRNGAWAGSSLPLVRFVGTGAIDAGGTPHVLFAAASGVAHATVSADTSAVTEMVSTVVSTTMRLESDRTGKLHALYSGNGTGVRYATRGSTGWVEETVPQGTGVLALRVDDAGNPHAIMSVAAGVAHARRVGGAWTIDSLGAPTAGVAAAVEDRRGTVHTIGVSSTGAGLGMVVHYVHEQFCLATDVVDAPPARASTSGLWVPRVANVKPTPRAQAATVYDPVRKEVVLYGGNASTLFTMVSPGGAWTLPSAGGGWTQKTDAAQPGQRPQPAMTFDSGRGRAVLMGSSVGETDIWEWDGTVWTSRPSTAPMPALGRNSVGLAYDSARSRVVVSATDGIWEWNGSTGTFLSRAPSPPAYVTYPSTLFYDSGSGNVVGMGGSKAWEWNPTTNAFTDLGVTVPTGVVTQTTAGTFILYDGKDMWRWRRQGPVTWERLTTQGTGPMRRNFSSLTYDPARGAVIVFGGHDPYQFTGIKVYVDPANPSRDGSSNTTTEWLPPS